MNKEIRKVKLISKNVLESLSYYSKYNSQYLPKDSFHINLTLSENLSTFGR